MTMDRVAIDICNGKNGDVPLLNSDTSMRQRRSNCSSDTPSPPERVPARKKRRPRFRKRARSDVSTRIVHSVLIFLVLLVTFLAYLISATRRSNATAATAVATAAATAAAVPSALFRQFTDSAPPCDPMEPEDVVYTLATQCSYNRLWMMKFHCNQWGPDHPISIAVFASNTSAQIHDYLVEDLGCNPDMLTLQVLSTDLYPPNEFPVNVLRNTALSAVQTSHVMYVDIDFWESHNLADVLLEPMVREVMASDPKQAIVVPAFQIYRQCSEEKDCHDANIELMPTTMRDIVTLIRQKKLTPFDPTNPGGHYSTSYGNWTKQTRGELLDLPCIKSNRYEPYIAFRYCRDMPPFQEKFSGYGKNKMTTIMHMRRAGYQFSQIGQAFVTHYPHKDSKSRTEWNGVPEQLLPYENNGKWYKKKPKDVKDQDWTLYKRGKVDALFVEFRKWLQTDILDESRVPMCERRNDDDSTLWIDRPELEPKEKK